MNNEPNESNELNPTTPLCDYVMSVLGYEPTNDGHDRMHDEMDQVIHDHNQIIAGFVAACVEARFSAVASQREIGRGVAFGIALAQHLYEQASAPTVDLSAFEDAIPDDIKDL